MLKTRDYGMIKRHQYTQGDFAIFARVSFSQDFASVKFHENKTLAKISEFTATC